MKYQYLIFSLFAFVLLIGFVNATSNQINLNATTYTTNGPQLAVEVLNYNPYPVDAGTWFDLWIKVQNVGSISTPNATFTLVPGYPFSTNDTLVRNYGIIPYSGDASAVILEYRIFAAANAPTGNSNITFVATSNAGDPNSPQIVNYLPIAIADTTTDFDVVPQTTTGQGVSFAISNIGENAANAITVTLEPASLPNMTRNFNNSQTYSNRTRPGGSFNSTLTGPTSQIIGNLASGDFTTVSFLTSLGSTPFVTIKIDYTDIAGVRDSVVKVVSLGGLNGGGNRSYSGTGTSRTTSTTTSSRTKYIYGFIGLVIGVIVVLVYQRIRRKNK